ncbi:MAG: rhodanese-like domain-containing protein [Gammaproteobacteria bacterium]|nr:rhodanese-like domain-containing protein [Gammaproteobacteria bacterium]
MPVSSINAGALKEKMEQPQAMLLIDVREQHEWDEGHIEGAIHLPLQTVPTQIQTHVPDMHTPIHLYCRGGGRSLQAATKLLEQGYQSVFNVEGGITAWQKAGFNVIV